MADSDKRFNPAALPLRQMRGGDYMDIKWRLVWLREHHPDARIVTDEKAHDPGKWATFRATVEIPGGGLATGHGSETAGDFGDYYEKAETKALGRALAALGFGAQFLPEDGEALADSPVDRPQPQGATQRPQPAQRPTEQVNRETGEIMATPRPQATPGQPATEKQIKFLHAVAKDQGLSHTDLHDRAVDRFNKGVGDLDRAEISTLIDGLKGGSPQSAPTPIRQSDTAPDNGGDVAWTEFWKWARLNDVATAPKFTELTQRSIQGLTPAQARELLSGALASMPATGTAGGDKWTQ